MATKVVKVEAEDVKALQEAHVTLKTYQDNIAYLFELNNTNPSFLDSPIFVEYQNRCKDAVKAFDAMKDVISKKYLETSGVVNPTNWNVDYNTYDMTITY